MKKNILFLFIILMQNFIQLQVKCQKLNKNAQLSGSSISVICEQGLYFIISGNRIYGAVSFVPRTGSCSFVFKGEKKNGFYEIYCSDFDENQVKNNNLFYNIHGKIIFHNDDNIKMTLEKDPDKCGKAFGVSFTDVEGIDFDILKKRKNYFKNIGIVKENFECIWNSKKYLMYKNSIINILSLESNNYAFEYHDDILNKDIKATVNSAKILCIK